MEAFKLDSQLAESGFVLGELDTSLLLLMNNKVAPWFVLVPKVTGVSELYELDAEKQQSLLNELNQLSRFIKAELIVDKLNIAAIGNIVRQLHIHVIARTENDTCWPGVVWGAEFNEVYTQDEVDDLINRMREKLPGFTTSQR